MSASPRVHFHQCKATRLLLHRHVGMSHWLYLQHMFLGCDLSNLNFGKLVQHTLMFHLSLLVKLLLQQGGDYHFGVFYQGGFSSLVSFHGLIPNISYNETCLHVACNHKSTILFLVVLRASNYVH